MYPFFDGRGDTEPACCCAAVDREPRRASGPGLGPPACAFRLLPVLRTRLRDFPVAAESSPAAALHGCGDTEAACCSCCCWARVAPGSEPRLDERERTWPHPRGPRLLPAPALVLHAVWAESAAADSASATSVALLPEGAILRIAATPWESRLPSSCNIY